MKRNRQDLMYYLVLVCVPTFFVVLLGLYLSKLYIDKHIRDFGNNYLNTMERKVDALTKQADVILSSTSDCEEIAYRLALWPTVKHYLTITDGLVHCQSPGIFRLVDSGLADADLERGVYSFPGESRMKEPVLLVVAQDRAEPSHRGMLVVEPKDIMGYMAQAQNIQYEKLAIWIGDKPLFDRTSYDFSAMQFFRSNRYDLQLGIQPAKNYVRNVMLMFVLASLPVGLMTATAAHFIIMRIRPHYSLVEEIKKGLCQGEFYLLYQPVYDASGELFGFEALARWKHAKMGEIGPDIFIPAIEQNELGIDFTRYVFRRAAEDMANLSPGKRYHLGINVPPEFMMSPDFEQILTDDLVAYRNLPVALTLEITERQLLGESAIEQINIARALGVKVAIDDFGVGHTSLSMLQCLQVDYLKIDKCFVDTVGVDSVNAAVLEAIIALAHRLNIAIVAEGVENRQQMDFLNRKGCQYQQGYYFSRPLSLEDTLSLTGSPFTRTVYPGPTRLFA